MAAIKHRVGIQAPVAEVWEAITIPEKLSGWWSSSGSGSANVGSRLDLVFDGLVTLSFEVIESEEGRLLHLLNQGGPGPWDQSHLWFELSEDSDQTFVVLKHDHPDASEEDFQFFMTKWPLFLVSLKSYLETGRGRPFPNDIKIQADL